jgi:hypothetical protein
MRAQRLALASGIVAGVPDPFVLHRGWHRPHGWDQDAGLK